MAKDEKLLRNNQPATDHRSAGDLAFIAGDLTTEEAALAAHHSGLDRTLGGFFAALAHLGTGRVGDDLGPGGIGSSHVRIILPDGQAILVSRQDSAREPIASAVARPREEPTDARFERFERDVDPGDEDRSPAPGRLDAAEQRELEQSEVTAHPEIGAGVGEATADGPASIVSARIGGTSVTGPRGPVPGPGPDEDRTDETDEKR